MTDALAAGSAGAASAPSGGRNPDELGGRSPVWCTPWGVVGVAARSTPRTLLPAILLLAAGGGLSIAGGSVAAGGLLILAALMVGIAAVWGRRRAR